jgi:ferredoxin
MNDAEIKFEREGAEGLVAIGSYLSDAAKRFGIRFEAECSPAVGEHFCQVQVVSGAEFLSDRTTAENEADLDEGWRIACHAKITKPGEVVVMTKEKPAAVEEEKDKAEDYRKRFEELPLEKKMAELVRLESIALSETLSFVVNSPYKVADKLMDFLAEFGFRAETEKKESAKPEEHRANGTNGTKAKAKESDASKTEAEESIVDSEERKDA